MHWNFEDPAQGEQHRLGDERADEGEQRRGEGHEFAIGHIGIIRTRVTLRKCV